MTWTDLLEQMDGFVVDINGQEVTLNTADASTRTIESTVLEGLLGVLTNPSIALLLISMGSLAIVYEIINPGGYIGGVVGVILLLVGFFAVGQLPVNYAGLALIILAIVLFVAELFTPTFGALTATGAIAFVLGALILFNTSEFAYQLPLPSIIGIPIFVAVIVAFGFRKVLEVRNRQPATGAEGIIGSVGVVKTPLEPEGTIFVWGERWYAASEDGQEIPVGSKVTVTKLEGFHLTVRKKD
jgi:membrane-bound serine protease (ClpP class)